MEQDALYAQRLFVRSGKVCTQCSVECGSESVAEVDRRILVALSQPRPAARIRAGSSTRAAVFPARLERLCRVQGLCRIYPLNCPAFPPQPIFEPGRRGLLQLPDDVHQAVVPSEGNDRGLQAKTSAAWQIRRR